MASYLRQAWDKNDGLYEGQHGFRLGYLCENQVITVCQDIADSLDKGDRIDVIIIDFLKAFDLVPHDRLRMKIVISGVDSRVVALMREFLLGHTQSQSRRAIIRGVRVTSGVLQGSVLGLLLFVAYVNDIWRNIESTVRLFADDCVIYKKIIKSEDIEKLQKDLYRLGEWAVENAIK